MPASCLTLELSPVRLNGMGHRACSTGPGWGRTGVLKLSHLPVTSRAWRREGPAYGERVWEEGRL